MCRLPSNKPLPVSVWSVTFQVLPFFIKCCGLQRFSYATLAHTLSKNYKDEPLPGGEDTAPNAAAAMAQILFFPLHLYRSISGV